MEDLIPFLIFIVVVIINLVKYAAEKGGKSKAAPKDGQPSTRRPSPLEDFFEDLARKFEPEPVDVPEWPEDRERPDYMQEMQDFEEAEPEPFSEETTAEIIPMPTAVIETIPEPISEMPMIPEIAPPEPIRPLQSAMKSMPGLMSAVGGVRLRTASILRSSNAGRIDFPLRKKADLRKAVIANLIFGSPRAYDTSFENTVMK